MGDGEISEIARSLGQKPVNGLRISLEEFLEDIPGNSAQIANYGLRYVSLDGSFNESYFLDVVEPEEMGEARPVDDNFNLQALADRPLDKKLYKSKQLGIMKKALDHIAGIDPRIKGEDAEPLARIVKVGNARYNLEFMKAFYSYISEECSKL